MPHPAGPPLGASRPRRAFRPDIEGLRAVAILLVLACHAGIAQAGRGVVGIDVLLVIGGFLTTDGLVRELERTGRVRPLGFLARRVARLVPAAALVIVLAALASWALVRGGGRHALGQDVIGSATGVVNWVLAYRATTWPDAEPGASPLHHFWSLAVGAQLSVLWVLTLAALGWLLRRAASGSGLVLRPTRRLLGGLLATVCVPSFLWALYQGEVAPDSTYLMTAARLWEPGLGAALAVALQQRAPVQNRWITLGGWLGLLAIVWAGLRPAADIPWPGTWTLVPVLGTVLVLLSGWSAGTLGPGPVLGWLPLVWLGGLSYELYLWHWPLVVLAEHHWGGTEAAATARIVAVALAVVPAWLTHRFVVNRVRLSPRLRSPRPTLALGSVLTLAAVLAGLPLVLSASPFATAPRAGALPPIDRLGAATLGPAPSSDPARYQQQGWDFITPDPQRADQDRPAATGRCEADGQATRATRCTFGDLQGTTTIALVGDAKALQWLPALLEVATERHWRITTYTKASCTFAQGQAALDGRHYRACDAWVSSVMSALEGDRPTLVLTSAHGRTVWAGDRASTNGMVTGLAAQWQEVRALGIRIAVLGDNPSSPDGLEECMTRHARTLTACRFSRAVAVNDSALPLQKEAASVAPGTQLVDLTPWLCPVEQCPVVIGNVAIHRSGDQVTATYARTLAPVLRSSVDALLAKE